MRFPTGDQWQPWSYLAPFRRYGGMVEKIAKIASLYPPKSHKSPSLGVTPIEFRDERTFPETRMLGFSDREEIMTLAFFVLIQHRSVTDRRTAISPLAKPAASACIALLCYRAGKNGKKTVNARNIVSRPKTIPKVTKTVHAHNTKVAISTCIGEVWTIDLVLV